ncbi:acetyl-CoA carboxylase biotin carboxyl carrier protein [Saccharomonospora amisosensis]|uniref:Biotin carboxyl carrier protein of acetyl-CoA carboxylase n=1 Tax=Saccharomonospora amisosensis TaxID=1128677 RepID=A0A7X5UPN1_9PSEU|nr:biotin/lipoyl-containing protein [Saccharomonospora amisosensis]NIJ11865.1 acetyl-CoA carboxylase biotin carboxyl carrier protein [Saccharomonospora amisosensis]
MNPSNLTDEDVRDILELVDSTTVDELHLRTSRFSLTLRRDGGGWTRSTTVHADPVEGEQAEPHEPPDAEQVPPGLVPVRAPLPGTFYRAPKPGAAPFVEVGDHVEDTTVVGIVETMKLMNSVVAGTAGTVTEIRLGNAAPAAQGAVLVLIEADGS